MLPFHSALLTLAVVGLVGTQQRRPIVLDYEGPPASIESMVSEAPVVILGTVLKRDQAVAGPADFVVPFVKHSVRVAEVLKGPSTFRAQDTVVVAQPGGIAVIGGVEWYVDERSYPIYPEGQKVLLFLEYDKFYGAYASKWGPGGSFLIRSDKARVPKSVTRHPEIAGKTEMATGELLSLIRRFVRG